MGKRPSPWEVTAPPRQVECRVILPESSARRKAVRSLASYSVNRDFLDWLTKECSRFGIQQSRKILWWESDLLYARWPSRLIHLLLWAMGDDLKKPYAEERDLDALVVQTLEMVG